MSKLIFLPFTLIIIDTVYSIALILFYLGSGLSLFLEGFLRNLNLPSYFLAAAYLLVISFFYYLLNLPLNFYTGFILEHRFNLSKQKPSNWWMDQLKSGILAYVISLILILTFYYQIFYSVVFCCYKVDWCL